MTDVLTCHLLAADAIEFDVIAAVGLDTGHGAAVARDLDAIDEDAGGVALLRGATYTAQ